MSVELYTQQSIFNVGLSSMRPIAQLCDPMNDQDLVTKKFLEEKLALLEEIPLQLPRATTSVLGCVKQGSGLYISPDGTMSVVDYEKNKILSEWLQLNGANTINTNTWIAQNSSNITPLNIFNQAITQITGISGAVQDYDSIYKISNTLSIHSSAVNNSRNTTTWVQQNSSNLTTNKTTSTVSIGQNTITLNGLDNIIIGHENNSNSYNNNIIIGNSATPQGSNRVVIGSDKHPLTISPTAGSSIPVGFLLVEINGNEVKIPYYDV